MFLWHEVSLCKAVQCAMEAVPVKRLLYVGGAQSPTKVRESVCFVAQRSALFSQCCSEARLSACKGGKKRNRSPLFMILTD